eukprot:Rhum_TRINITY_DN14840_c17_g10::Rhum_TRINITY_DN14840_c17_g10_i1::g.125405::m.125405
MLLEYRPTGQLGLFSFLLPEEVEERERESESEKGEGQKWAGPGGPTTASLDLLRQLGEGSEGVLEQAVVRQRHDRRVRVGVDGHDRLRVLHARHVLDGTRDARRHVQLRRHDFAGLSHLQLRRHPARVDDRTRRADGGAQLVRQTLDQVPVRGVLETLSAGHDAVSGLQVRLVRRRHLVRHPLRQPALRRRHRLRLRGATEGGLVEGRTADGQHLDGAQNLHVRHGVACVRRALEAVLRQDVRHVGERLRVEEGADARRNALAERARRREHVREAVGLRQVHDHVREVLRQPVLHLGALRVQHLRHAVHLRDGVGGGLARDDGSDLTELAGRGEGAEGGGGHSLRSGLRAHKHLAENTAGCAKHCNILFF